MNSYITLCWWTRGGFSSVTLRRSAIFLLVNTGCSCWLMFPDRQVACEQASYSPSSYTIWQPRSDYHRWRNIYCASRVSFRTPAPVSSFRVTYKMERECARSLEMASKLAEVIFCDVKNRICFQAIPLTLRTARKSRDKIGNATKNKSIATEPR